MFSLVSRDRIRPPFLTSPQHPPLPPRTSDECRKIRGNRSNPQYRPDSRFRRRRAKKPCARPKSGAWRRDGKGNPQARFTRTCCRLIASCILHRGWYTGGPRRRTCCCLTRRRLERRLNFGEKLRCPGLARDAWTETWPRATTVRPSPAT